jgi:neutral ceramidase
VLHEAAAPSPAPVAPARAGLHVGLDEVDITPQPGLGMFGHGPEGRIARGHRGHIYCRTLLAIDERGESLAWAVCDLGAISALLHGRVAERTLKLAGIGADRLILSATHTHAGPAHFFGARSQNGPRSSEANGFDEQLLTWLADRIAGSIARAKADALSKDVATLGWHFGKLSPRTAQNRSLSPHCTNPQPMGNLPSSCGSDVAVYEEVDSTISVLRVERGGKVTGLFAVLGMHPTAVPNTNELYHGDVFGIAARRLHYSLPDRPVVALANGVSGDVSPVLSRQSWPEAERVGAQLASDVLAANEAPGTVAPPELQRAYREVTLRAPELCAQGGIGAGSLGGSEDGRTRSYAMPQFREGVKLPVAEGCQGVKDVWDEAEFEGEWAFSRFVPMSLARLGGALLVALPFEPTTTPGLLLRQRLEQQTRTPTVLLALSNDYLGYVTSEKEYEQQNYEGGLNVYGARSAAFFDKQVSALLLGLDSPRSVPLLNQSRAHDFSPWRRITRFAAAPAERARQIVRQPFQAEPTQRGMAIEWRVSDTALLVHDGRETSVADGPLVRIEMRKPDGGWAQLLDELGAPVDDTSTSVWLKQRRSRENHYVAVWQPWRTLAGRFRIVIGRKTGVVASKEFEL